MHRWIAFSLILAGLALACWPRSVAAQELPPRPEPPATQEDSPRRERGASPATGLITGTVIDLTSGAPVPGIPVTVGDVTVLSDENGNYGRDGLAPGSYAVALALPEGSGVAEQEPFTVELAAGATVVHHLAFRSPAAETPEPPAVEAPAVEETPASLPATGAGEGASESLGVLLAGAALLGAGAVLRRRHVC